MYCLKYKTSTFPDDSFGTVYIIWKKTNKFRKEMYEVKNTLQ